MIQTCKFLHKCCECGIEFYAEGHYGTRQRLLYRRSEFSGQLVPTVDLPDTIGLCLIDTAYSIANDLGTPLVTAGRYDELRANYSHIVQYWTTLYGSICSFTCMSKKLTRVFRDFGHDKARVFVEASIGILNLEDPANMNSKWGEVVASLFAEPIKHCQVL